MTLAHIEERVRMLESKVDRLDKSVRSTPDRWWHTDAGRFANDPLFDQIVEEGRKYRESLRPKARKSKR